MTLDQMWIFQWGESGIRFPVGERQTITLPKGRTMVYYESPHSVPSGPVTFTLFHPDGRRARVGRFVIHHGAPLGQARDQSPIVPRRS